MCGGWGLPVLAQAGYGGAQRVEEFVLADVVDVSGQETGSGQRDRGVGDAWQGWNRLGIAAGRKDDALATAGSGGRAVISEDGPARPG